MQKPYTVGIAGASASGKTMFVRLLAERFGKKSIAILSQDNYYRPIEEQAIDEEGHVNFDLPGGIDHERMLADLQKLLIGETIEYKRYTFNVDNEFALIEQVEPAEILLVEGLFIYHFEGISAMLDLRLFIDASDDVKLERRLKRDMRERGYSEEQIRYQWHRHVLPGFKLFLEPHRKNVDMLINNEKGFTNALDVLTHHLEKQLTIK